MDDSGTELLGSGRMLLCRRLAWVVSCLAVSLGLSAWATPGTAAQTGEQPRILATEVATEITPVVAEQVADGVARAEEGAYAAYVIQLDTPGGLETSMRQIV